MLESLFRLLFNYRPVVFQQGEFRWCRRPGRTSRPRWSRRRDCRDVPDLSRREVEERDARHRVVLAALRTAILLLVLFCLFRPVLVVKAAVPQQNFLGVLIDDSRSMQIADWNAGAARGLRAPDSSRTPDAPLLKALSERFVSGRSASRRRRRASAQPADLTFAGTQTRLGAALDGARQELAGLPLAGLVLVTDGADTTDASLSDALLAMKAASMPVFTVGVGQESLAQGHPGRSRVGRRAPRSRARRCSSTSS